MKRFLPDSFSIALVCTVLFASQFPISGEPAAIFSIATKIAIALLFFLHGARLSRDVVIAGLLHWRLHLVIVSVTFDHIPARRFWPWLCTERHSFAAAGNRHHLSVHPALHRPVLHCLHLDCRWQCACCHLRRLSLEYFRHVHHAASVRPASFSREAMAAFRSTRCCRSSPNCCCHLSSASSCSR